MRHWTNLSGTASLILTAFAAASMVPAARAQNPPKITVQITASREWTNDDVDQLRAEAPISYFSAEPASPQAQTAAPNEVALKPRPPRTQDPEWYAEQAAVLEAELESRQTDLAQYAKAIQDAKDRTRMESGLSLDQRALAVTPDSGVEILQARVAEVESEMDALADLARVNGIAPAHYAIDVILRGLQVQPAPVSFRNRV